MFQVVIDVFDRSINPENHFYLARIRVQTSEVSEQMVNRKRKLINTCSRVHFVTEPVELFGFRQKFRKRHTVL